MQHSIWLAYVSCPITTATYFEKAFRKTNSVITMGPKITPEIIKLWNLGNMKAEVKEHDFLLHPDVDMRELTSDLRPDQFPEVYIWIESVPGYYPKNLDVLPCKKACYLIDTHLNFSDHIKWAKHFDYVFLAQQEYIPAFKEAGMQNTFWLPLGCDPETHGKKSLLKKYDIGFVGTVSAGSRREQLLRALGNRYPVELKRCFLEEMAEHFSHSKMVFNNAVLRDLNMRVFEVMCSGTFLLTDKAENSGLTELFHDGECLAYYDDIPELLEKAGYYLKHGDLRERIAAKGMEIALRAHTYEHRCNDMLDVIFERRPNTPDIAELRERARAPEDSPQTKPKEYSVADLMAIEEKYSAKRSFIIPVLDLSSQTQYNFNTLLDDLEKVEGDVIAVFNSLEMADLFKNHPRITYYASMSHNFGVARAWNIGLDMSNAPVSYILNSDLHFEPAAIYKLEEALFSLPDAAIVGPEGGFIDFFKSADIERFVKGTFTEPLLVDNVSGFFFGVKTHLFHDCILNFENKFTPCYYEEWDLGIQVKAKGLKAYIVPVTEYVHEFNTKARTGNLRYMRTEETVLEISGRNQKLFWKKWLQGLNETSSTDHIKSLWYQYKMSLAEAAFARNDMQEAYNLFMQINYRDGEIAAVNYYLALLLARANHIPEARTYAEKAVALEPDLLLARELLQNLPG